MALLTACAAGACWSEGESGGSTPSQDPTIPVAVSGAAIAQPVLGERTALYFTITNTGTEPDTLLAVDVGDLGTASLHASEMDDGVSRMRAREALELPAAGRVQLRPGGLHVMIEDLTRPLSVGDTVTFSLRFARSGPMNSEARVVAYADLLDILDSGR